MINNLLNNLQIDLFKGPEGFINFALSAEFDEHLVLPRSGHRIRDTWGTGTSRTGGGMLGHSDGTTS
jgi:hypothetical protein